MNTKNRNTVILVVVLLTALAFIAYPRLFPRVPEDEEFAPTENPMEVLTEAQNEDRKVMLEFYQDG